MGGFAGARRAPLASWSAHSGDVWEVHFSTGPLGQLLSCSSDCTLQAWTLSSDAVGRMAMLGGAAGDGDAAAPTSRTLGERAQPINSLHISEEHGMLASASDAEVLTFIDMRA